MIAPTVHLNGTSANELKDQYAGACDGLTDALERLKACAPHGRDYYPQGAGAYVLASHYHREAMIQLTAIYEDLVGVLNNIHEQTPIR